MYKKRAELLNFDRKASKTVYNTDNKFAGLEISSKFSSAEFI